MNGLILAAGEGSRLAADGITQPKAMVQVSGRPLLVGLVETLEMLGCSTITCMVPADRAGPLAAALPRPGHAVIGCQTPSSLHTLAHGLAAVPPGPVFCTMVDSVMPRRDWKKLYAGITRALAAGAELVLAVTPYVADDRPVYVVRDGDGAVREVRDEPVDPPCVTGGVYGLSSVARLAPRNAVERGVKRMREFLQSAARGGLRTTAVEVPKIIDLDRASDLSEARTWFAAEGAR
ncbi:MAG: NTP transferase domain-containing protein [Gemmatimonadetes bacterium]|nr:NTP transferase domain-containing protein [Gemmatimonadota bacterium]